LLRTLSQPDSSPSVTRLHPSAGLRVSFASDEERDRFAAAFAGARAQEKASNSSLITAIFDDRASAEAVVADLIAAGMPNESISLLWRTDEAFAGLADDGHSVLSVAAATAGGGLAGAMLGVALLAIPGIGPVAAAGAIAASAFSSVASISAAIGATGGAVARMLSDIDVDRVDADYFERQIRRGKVFVSIDTRIATGWREMAQLVVRRHGGKAAPPVKPSQSVPKAFRDSIAA